MNLSNMNRGWVEKHEARREIINDLFEWDLVFFFNYFPIQNERKRTSNISSTSIRAVMLAISLAALRKHSPARARSPLRFTISRKSCK